MLPSAFVPLYQPRASSGNGHGRPIHAYADSSPGFSLPFVWDRCPLLVTANCFLTAQCSSFPSGLLCSWGGSRAPHCQPTPSSPYCSPFGGEHWAPYMTATKPHFAWPLGWQGGILPTHPPQLICTSMLDCARVASLPNGLAFPATLWFGTPPLPLRYIAYREAESIVIRSGRFQARIVYCLCERGSGRRP